MFYIDGGGETLLSNKIHMYRAEKNLTQQQLAEAVQVSRQTIVAMEKNKYNPSLILAFKIASALEKEITEVFSFHDEEEK